LKSSYVIPTSPLRYLELPTKSKLQAGSLSTTFLTSLALSSYLVDVNRTFTNFLMTHHKLGNSRVVPSHLWGFTSNSNKCHKDYYTKLKCSQRGSHSTLSLDFSQITQTSLRCGGRGLKGSMMCFSLMEPATSKVGREKLLYLSPEN
jgi:hypothetical protein